MKRNKLKITPHLLNKTSIRQIFVYSAAGVGIAALLFAGAFFYLNLGNSEKAMAANDHYTSLDNQQNLWKDPSSWQRRASWLNPTPQGDGSWTTHILGIVTYEVTEEEGAFAYYGSNTLNVTDTLIFTGDLTLTNSGKINVAESGVLIVLGNLSLSGAGNFKNKGRVVVTEDLSATGSGKVNNTANNNNGFYLYGTPTSSGAGSYGNNLKNESNLQNDDESLYLYVNGLGNILLPISLLDFTAQKEGNAVLLEWSTASEIDNDFFTIERSANGIDWEAIITIDGAKNSNKKLDYEYQDKSPLSGYNYYRLKQTDFNGDFEYFKIVGINFDKNFVEENAFKVPIGIQAGPNPFKDFVTVTYTAQSTAPIAFIVRDITGAVVHKEELNPLQGENEYTFASASDLKPGVYIINMVRDGDSEAVKVIKI